jgi:AcrR family transcriptional regulator
MQAAARLIVRYEDATVGAVAQATGVARGTIYRYFPTRQALLTAVIDQALRKAERQLTQANVAAVPVADGRARAVRAWSPSATTSWSWFASGCSPEGTSRPSPLWLRCWTADAKPASFAAICPCHARSRRCMRWRTPACAPASWPLREQRTSARPRCGCSWKGPSHRPALHAEPAAARSC